MKVLIIGGTGLISTSIVHELLERGDEVTVYNRGVTPKRIPDEVTILQGDRTLYGGFEAEMARHHFDAVIDMVAFVPSDADSLLRAFRGRVKHLVVCSTVCVYGGPLTRLPATDDEPHRPVTQYGQNKSTIEQKILAANGQGGLHTTVLRPSFTTGEGATMGTLFDATLPERLRNHLPVIVHDDGNAAWAIAHTSDVAKGFVGALLNERAYGQAFHLTSAEFTTWNGVFRAMCVATGSRSELVHIPSDWLYRVAPRRSVGIYFMFKYPSIFDNMKAARDLGFRTTVPLVETFRRQIAWMDHSGTTKATDEDPFQDILIQAFRCKTRPDPDSFRDFNTWGNSTEC